MKQNQTYERTKVYLQKFPVFNLSMSQVESEKTLKENIELNNQQEQRNQEVTIKKITTL